MTDPRARPADHTLAADEPLERWSPDARYAKAGWGFPELAPTVFIALLTLAVTGFMTHRVFLVFVLAFVALVALLLVRNAPGKRSRILVDGVSFELTPRRVRVVMGDARRELRIASIRTIDVLPMSGRADVGHVVIRSDNERVDEGPAIPCGRRVGAGSAGLVFWATVEYVDPAEQLFEGALTFWYVPHPDDVRRRIEAAMAGVTPHERGPHR